LMTAKLMKYSPLLSPNLYFLLMLKITPNKFLSQNLQIGKLEGTSGNLRGPSGTLEPDKCGDACARGGAMRFAHAQYQQGRRETNNYKDCWSGDQQ
jgi:hypothetical protein